MPEPRYLPAPPPTQPPESSDLFDWGLLRDRVLLTVRAPGRHRVLTAACMAGGLLVAASSLWLLPWTYRSDVKLQAERNLVMPALGNPGRSIPREADMPTRGAVDEILRRDRLVALIARADLVEEWSRSRAPLGRLKDRLTGLVGDPPTPEDRVDALVGILEKRLEVDPREGTLTIAVEWPDPVVAARIVDTARMVFVDGRHAQEVATIADAVTILESHAARARTEMDEALREVARLGRASGARRVVVPRRAAPVVQVESAEEAQLRTDLSATRRAIEDVEQSQRRRLEDLNAEQARLLAIYAPAHPSVVAIQQSILALSGDSPQVNSLRQRAQQLMAELQRRTGRSPDVARAPHSADLDGGMEPANPVSEEGELLDHARARLRTRAQKYEELLARLGSARIELDTSRAAFKYRYGVLRPAQIPRRAESPDAPLSLLGGLLAGAGFAVLLASALERARGVVVEPWQLQRGLQLPVLAVMRPPELPGPGRPA